jgi:hypothetical protein
LPADIAVEGHDFLVVPAATVNCVLSNQSVELLALNFSILGAVTDVVDPPRKNSFLHLEACLVYDVWRIGVEAALLVVASQPFAVVAVAEVLECIHAFSIKLDWTENCVGVVAALVIAVHPDPVGTTPPELAIVVRLYADGATNVGVDGVDASRISLVCIKLQENIIFARRGDGGHVVATVSFENNTPRQLFPHVALPTVHI